MSRVSRLSAREQRTEQAPAGKRQYLAPLPQLTPLPQAWSDLHRGAPRCDYPYHRQRIIRRGTDLNSIIESRRDQINRLCRRFGVQNLDVFGSATGATFDAQHSDIDFIVDFGNGMQPDLFDRYFGLREALAELFGRKVDLVMAGGMVNPFFIASVNRTRQPVYARAHTEAA